MYLVAVLGRPVYRQMCGATSLLLRRPETSDTEFEWDGFIAANNNELVANFGNFVNRVLKFVNSEKTYDSVIPATPTADNREDFLAFSGRIQQHIEETILCSRIS